jgi:hypothetical protein
MAQRYTHVGAADLIAAWKGAEAARVASIKSSGQEEVQSSDAAAGPSAASTASAAAAPEPGLLTDPASSEDRPKPPPPVQQAQTEALQSNVVQVNFNRRRTG